MNPAGTITLRALAELWGIPVETLKRWVAAGDLPVWRPGGKGGHVLVNLRRLEQHAFEQSAINPPEEEASEPSTAILQMSQKKGKGVGPSSRWRK